MHPIRVALLGTVVLGACSSAPSGSTILSPSTTSVAITTTTATAPTATELDAALAAAIAWSADHLDETDPFTLALLDAVGRHFGLTELAPAREHIRARLDALGPTPERRLLDPTARVDPTALRDPDAYRPGLLVAGALACDEPGRPADFESWLRDAIAAGGYDLTHVAVALGIERELGCDPTGGSALHDAVVRALRAAVVADEAADDLAIERIAMLHYLGELDSVPATRVRAVLDAQRADGSFTTAEPGFEAHTTALAIWVLAAGLEREEGRPDAGPPLLLPS